MRLLLDSHALLWFCEGSASLSQPARAAIENVENDTYVSHASAWEIAIKASLGKLKLAMTFEELFPGALISNAFRPLLSDFRHYRELLTLPPHHRDPFDRLLIAQVRVEGLTLVSCDPHFQPYGIPLL